MAIRQRKRLPVYNTIAGKQSLLIDTIAATLGAILTVGPFALLLFNLI